MEPYRLREFYVPADMMKSLHDYAAYGLQPGGWLTSVLMNDLVGASSLGTDENMRNLPAFIGYLYHECPPECSGSRDAVRAWVLTVARSRTIDHLRRRRPVPEEPEAFEAVHDAGLVAFSLQLAQKPGARV